MRPRAPTQVDAVHVWAFPKDGSAPIFLGAATLGIERPGVGAIHGPQFTFSGFNLIVNTPLPAANYSLIVFARSTVTGTFNNSVLVGIIVSP